MVFIKLKLVLALDLFNIALRFIMSTNIARPRGQRRSRRLAGETAEVDSEPTSPPAIHANTARPAIQRGDSHSIRELRPNPRTRYPPPTLRPAQQHPNPPSAPFTFTHTDPAWPRPLPDFLRQNNNAPQPVIEAAPAGMDSAPAARGGDEDVDMAGTEVKVEPPSPAGQLTDGGNNINNAMAGLTGPAFPAAINDIIPPSLRDPNDINVRFQVWGDQPVNHAGQRFRAHTMGINDREPGPLLFATRGPFLSPSRVWDVRNSEPPPSGLNNPAAPNPVPARPVSPIAIDRVTAPTNEDLAAPVPAPRDEPVPRNEPVLRNEPAPPSIQSPTVKTETPTKQPKEIEEHECLICCETYSKTKMEQPCRHCDSWFCHPCIMDMFERAIDEPGHMPPKCHMMFQLHVGLPHLSAEKAEKYRAKFEEWLAVDKVFCPVKTCSTFVPERLYHVKQVPIPKLVDFARFEWERIMHAVNARPAAGVFYVAQSPQSQSSTIRPQDFLSMLRKDSYPSFAALLGDMEWVMDNMKLPDHINRAASKSALMAVAFQEMDNIRVRSHSKMPLPQGKPSLFACPTCSIGICFECRQVAHPGRPCDTTQKDYEMAMMKQYGYKQCPVCKTAVKRMFGCSHMQCLCGAHWCWRCQRNIDDCPGDCGEDGDSDGSDYGEDDYEGDAEEAERDVAEGTPTPAPAQALLVNNELDTTNATAPNTVPAREDLAPAVATDAVANTGRAENRHVADPGPEQSEQLREEQRLEQLLLQLRQQYEEELRQRQQAARIFHEQTINYQGGAQQHQRLQQAEQLVQRHEQASQQIERELQQQEEAYVRLRRQRTGNAARIIVLPAETARPPRSRNRQPADLDAGGLARWGRLNIFGEEPVEPMSNVWSCHHSFHQVEADAMDKTVKPGVVVQCNRCFKKMEPRPLRSKTKREKQSTGSRPGDQQHTGSSVEWAVQSPPPAQDPNRPTVPSPLRKLIVPTPPSQKVVAHKPVKKEDVPWDCRSCNVLYCGECKEIMLDKRRAEKREAAKRAAGLI